MDGRGICAGAPDTLRAVQQGTAQRQFFLSFAVGQKAKMTVTAEEFLRRFMLHVLPRRFVRIRFSGFLANRRRKQLLPLCKQLLEDHPQQPTEPGSNEITPRAVWRCPHCGGAMVLIEKLTPRQIRRRSVDRKNLIDSS